MTIYRHAMTVADLFIRKRKQGWWVLISLRISAWWWFSDGMHGKENPNRVWCLNWVKEGEINVQTKTQAHWEHASYPGGFEERKEGDVSQAKYSQRLGRERIGIYSNF